MRKLATIRKIKEIKPIKNADIIELAIIDGWQSVVTKGKHYIGEIITYCEIDSCLPILPEYEFLRKTSFRVLHTGEECFLLKTMKFRGEVSQGLVLPLTFEANIGDDVTDRLNITLYDPPLPAELEGEAVGRFPSFINKTKEDRIQNLNYEPLLGYVYYLTEKLNGVSGTMFHNNGYFGVCGRKYELAKTEDSIFWSIVKEYNIEEKLKSMGNYAIQGEVIGCRKPYMLDKNSIRIFNVFDINKQKKLGLEFRDFVKEIGLETVPVLDENFKLPTSCNELLLLANNKSVVNSKIGREGLVVRSLDGTISFKVISNKILLDE